MIHEEFQLFIFFNFLKHFSYLQNAGSIVPFLLNRFCHWKELYNTFLAHLTIWNSKHCLNPDICNYILLHSLPTSLSVLVMHFLLTNLQTRHLSYFPLINHMRPQFFIILPSQLLLLHPRTPLQWGPSILRPSTHFRSTFIMALSTADQSCYFTVYLTFQLSTRYYSKI